MRHELVRPLQQHLSAVCTSHPSVTSHPISSCLTPQVLMSLASVLVEDKINNEILKDGIALPPVQHVQPIRPSVTLQDYMISMNTDFKYVP